MANITGDFRGHISWYKCDDFSSKEKAQPKLPYLWSSRPIFNPFYLQEKLGSQDFLHIFVQNYLLVNRLSCISHRV